MSSMGTRHLDSIRSERLQRAAMQASTRDSQLAESLILVQAALLAREGKREQSEALLLPLVNNPKPSTTALDLLAKICAQQGKYVEARGLWIHALQREPSNTHFLLALIRCAESQTVGSSGVLARHLAMLICNLVMLICGFAGICSITVLVVGRVVFHWW